MRKNKRRKRESEAGVGEKKKPQIRVNRIRREQGRLSKKGEKIAENKKCKTERKREDRGQHGEGEKGRILRRRRGRSRGGRLLISTGP